MASFGKKSPPEEERKMRVVIDERSSKQTIPRIWKINPSFKHINSAVTIARCVFVVALAIFFMVSAYLLTFDLPMAIGAGILISTMFIFVFRDQFYFLQSLSSLFFKKAKRVNPFRDLLFLLDGETSSALYICNKKDLVHTGLSIFRIKVIPENVHASMSLFIKSLSEYKNMVSFTYQIIKTPLLRKEQTELVESVQTYIYFCVHCSIKGTLNNVTNKCLPYSQA